VNDAMVRMLGYASREELLRADVSRICILRRKCGKNFCGHWRSGSSTELRGDAAAQGWDAAAHAAKYHCGARCAGRIAQIRGLMLDVTEQKTFQSQLQRERDFNQKILNTTQSMILVLDTAGLISYANRRCYETGYQEGELIGPAGGLGGGFARGRFRCGAGNYSEWASSGESGTAVRRSDGSMGISRSA